MLAVTSQRRRRRNAGQILPAIPEPEVVVVVPLRRIGGPARGSAPVVRALPVGVALEKRFSRLEESVNLINQTLIAIGEAAHETAASEGHSDG